jgi:hypothetical protein
MAGDEEEAANRGGLSIALLVLFGFFLGDHLGILAGLITRIVMVLSLGFFARLLLVRIFVVGHVVLL